jgi:hypothetical protein
VGHRPQPVVAQVLGEGLGQAEVVELADRPGREAVATRLLPGEALALDDEHPATALGQPVGGRRAGGPAADDQDVVEVAHWKHGPTVLLAFAHCGRVHVNM